MGCGAAVLLSVKRAERRGVLAGVDVYKRQMGDNRTNSQDSRYFGAIKESSVTGKAIFIYWPLTDVGPL